MAAISPTKAWVVGDVFTQQPSFKFHDLVERWNRAAWKLKSVPHRGSSYILAGVAAVSSTNIWAVGEYDNGTTHTLIEHYNGNA